MRMKEHKVTAISNDIKHFILTSIPSIPYLEAILLLRNNIEQEWDITQVAKRLFINDKDAAIILSQLKNAGMIVIVNKNLNYYQYQPKSDDLKQTIDHLAETYSTHLVEVTNLIHSNTNKKAQKFADAFLWRKDS